MLSAFRRLSKSKIGTTIMVLFLLAIVASFALVDIGGMRSSNFGLGSGTLARAGSEQVTERDLSDVFSRALSERRKQQPDATPATLAGDFDPLVDELINERVLAAFATKQDLILSKRLVDAEIAKIPGTRGLDGKFSDQAYLNWLGQQRLTDQLVRRLIASDIVQRLIIPPVAVNARIPVGVATPYASMLLEQRQGEVALVLTDAFKPGLNPSAGDLQAFYDQNKARYTVPEQRVLRMAVIAADKVTVPAPNDAEIAAYYKANVATYGGVEKRVISQAVVPAKALADGIAARARGGAAFAAAAAPAGLSAEDVSVGPQSRAEFANLAGAQVAAAVFAAPSGAVIGPIKSDLGWHVVKVDAIQAPSAASFNAARADIVAKLTAEKRKNALSDTVGKIEDLIANGSSLPEAAAAFHLTLTDTPLITAAGTARSDPAFKIAPEMAPALKSGFELSQQDDPVVEELTGGTGYVLVGVGRIAPAAPAALAEIRDRVTADWIQKKAAELARASAAGIAAKVARGVSLAQATAEAGKGAVPPRPLTARRIDIARANANIAAPVKMLFALGEGKSRMVADPQQRGFYIVHNVKITPGSAGSNPGLISQVQLSFQQAMGQELAEQFMTAVKKDIGVRRDEKAIAAAKLRLTQASN
ncbi:MAG: peptidyl-prolyl cis-trans isomerase [Sphingomicrobium sp.]